MVDGDLGRGVNPGVSKYGGPNEWSSGLVVKDEKGNVVTGIVGVQKPSSSSSSSSSSDGGSWIRDVVWFESFTLWVFCLELSCSVIVPLVFEKMYLIEYYNNVFWIKKCTVDCVNV